jgi:adenylate kinase family enzyme
MRFERWWRDILEQDIRHEQARGRAPKLKHADELTLAQLKHLSLSMKRHFIPYWVRDEVNDEMRSAAVERVHWQRSVRAGAELWASFDHNRSGWITYADTRRLLGTVVGPTGHTLSKKTQSEELLQDEKPARKLERALKQVKKIQEHLLKDLNADDQHDLVRQSAFEMWWEERPWIVKFYTMQHMDLERLWAKMATEGKRDLLPWEAKALLATVWEEKQLTAKARTEFNMKFIEWWVERDRDQSGRLTLEELSAWWVRQDPRKLALAERINWDTAEQHFSTESIFEELSAGDRTSIHGDSQAVQSKAKREQRYEEALAKMESEIKEAEEDLRGDDEKELLVRVMKRSTNKAWKTVLKQDEAPYGVLKGAVRPPMIRTRLPNYLALRDRQKLRKIMKGPTGLDALAHPQKARAARKANKEADLLLAVKQRETEEEDDNTGAVQLNSQGGTLAMGDMLRHYHSQNAQWLWVGDLRLWLKKFSTEHQKNLWSDELDTIQRKFGHGIYQIMALMRWMFFLNLTLSLMWMCTVIYPREKKFGQGGFWNTTNFVIQNLLVEDDTSFSHSQTSLFYDGYAKQPVEWMWLPLRLDLLYFLAVLLNVGISLYLIRSKMGSGRTDLNFHESNDCASLLGDYDHTIIVKSNELEMRQEVRAKLDTWLQSHEEALRQKEVDRVWYTRLGHQARIYVGRSLTLVLLGGHVTALTYFLTAADSLKAKGLGFLSPLSISILNVSVPALIKAFVMFEHHIHHLSELQSIMSRIFAFKIIQLFVILYNLTKLAQSEVCSSPSNTVDCSDFTAGDQASCEDVATCVYNDAALCPEARYGETFLRLVMTDALVFMSMQYFGIYAVNHGLPKLHMWYNVTAHFTKPLRTQYNDEQSTKTAKAKEKKRQRDMFCCRKGDRLQMRVEKREPASMKEYFSAGHVPKTRQSWWLLKKPKAMEPDKNGDDPTAAPKVTRKNKETDIVAWAESKQMQLLTKLKPHKLRVMGQLLIDAGWDDKDKVIDSNMAPRQIEAVIRKQRGKHKYVYKDSNAVSKVQKAKAEEAKLKKAGKQPAAQLGGVFTNNGEVGQRSPRDFTRKPLLVDPTEGGSLQKYDTMDSPRSGQSASNKAKYVLVIGGPGAGKGTLCTKLAEEVGAVHLSMGEIMRAEQSDPASESVAVLRSCLDSGELVPTDLTIKLLKASIATHPVGKTILIDGFPRSKEQAEAFGQDLDTPRFALFLNATKDQMESRVVQRGAEGGRADDNLETFEKRWQAFDSDKQVIEDYLKNELDYDFKIREVDAGLSVDEVYAKAREAFQEGMAEIGGVLNSDDEEDEELLREENAIHKAAQKETDHEALVNFTEEVLNLPEHVQARTAEHESHYQHVNEEAILAYDKAIELVKQQDQKQPNGDIVLGRKDKAVLEKYEKRLLLLRGELLECMKGGEKDWPKILDTYETALRMNEMDADLQEKVAKLGRRFNKLSLKCLDPKARKEDESGVKYDPIHTFAVELVKSEGEWEEVTELVNAQRLHRLKPQKFSSFRTSLLMMEILYRQTFVWVGSTWCPWLPLVAAFMQLLMFNSLKHAFLGFWWVEGQYEGRGIWSAEQIFSIFMSFALVSVLICSIPILIWLNQEPVCGPHSAMDYVDHFGQLVEGHNAKVFETLGVFLEYKADEQEALGQDDIPVAEIGVVGGILLNPPILIIFILFILVRYRTLQKRYKVLDQAANKKSHHFDKEREFLESQVRDLALKIGTGTKDLDTVQQTKELASRKQEQKEIDKIVSDMTRMSKRETFGIDEISVSELQQLVELTGNIMQDKEGTVQIGSQHDMLFELLASATVWIGNIESLFASGHYVQREMTKKQPGCVVLACTVFKRKDEDADQLYEAAHKEYTEKHTKWRAAAIGGKTKELEPVDMPRWYFNSWAVRSCTTTSRTPHAMPRIARPCPRPPSF